MMRTLTYGLVGLFLLSPLGEAAIDTDFLQQSWSRQWVRHVEVGRHQVRWRQRASRTDGIFAGVRFEVPLDRQAVWERSNDYTDLSTMTPGVTAVRWIERQEHRQVLQVDVKVLWKRLTLTFEVEQDPPTAMRFRLVHPIVGEYRGLCVFEASAAPKAGSPAFAVSPWRQPGEEGEAGVAAKPGRQGTGEAEHGFGAVPPHGRQQGPRASARGAPPQSPGTVVELMTWLKPSRPVPMGLVLLVERMTFLRGVEAFLSACDASSL